MGWYIVQYILSLLTVLLARTFPQLQDDGPAPVYTTLRTPVYNSQESLQKAANRVCQIEGGLKKKKSNGEKEKSDLNKSEEQMVSEWWRQKPGEWSGNKLLSHGEIKVGSSKIWDVLDKWKKKKINCNGNNQQPWKTGDHQQIKQWTASSSKCLTRCSQMQTLPIHDGYTLTWLYYYRCGSTGCAFDLYLSGQQTSFSSKEPFKLKPPAGRRGAAVEVARKG